jgi:hypothetical protein
MMRCFIMAVCVDENSKRLVIADLRCFRAQFISCHIYKEPLFVLTHICLVIVQSIEYFL